MKRYFPIILFLAEISSIISSIKSKERGRMIVKKIIIGKTMENKKRESFSILFLHELKNLISECWTPNEIMGCIRFEIAKSATTSPWSSLPRYLG